MQVLRNPSDKRAAQARWRRGSPGRSFRSSAGHPDPPRRVRLARTGRCRTRTRPTSRCTTALSGTPGTSSRVTLRSAVGNRSCVMPTIHTQACDHITAWAWVWSLDLQSENLKMRYLEKIRCANIHRDINIYDFPRPHLYLDVAIHPTCIIPIPPSDAVRKQKNLF